VLPLNLILSVSWILELCVAYSQPPYITYSDSPRSMIHLEELTFWLFLVHQGPTPREWFESWEYSVWKFGTRSASRVAPY
jgi:hypothetical protein